MNYGFEDEEASAFPPMVQVSIANLCNMSCGYCPHDDWSHHEGFQPRFMSRDLYTRIVDQMSARKSTLRLIARGEPLLHPDIVWMVKRAKQAGVETVNLITNGKRLDDHMARDLLEGGLDLLEVSLNASTKKAYTALGRQPDDFDRVVGNIAHYINLRDSGLGNTYVAVSFIVKPGDERELDDFRSQWEGIADDVVVRPIHDFHGHLTLDGKMPDRHPCRVLWSRFNVDYDGVVSVCYSDWDNRTPLGDVQESSIEDIWKSQAYERMRSRDLAGEPEGICASCNSWTGASWRLPYERLVEKAEQARR